MNKVQYSTKPLITLLKKQKVATIQELKKALGTLSNATVYRKLQEINARTSYSHRGGYYTLNELPDWNEFGLWTFRSVWFSVRGTLIETLQNLVVNSKAGYYASELEDSLHVEIKVPLLKLIKSKRLQREKVFGRYLYLSSEAAKRRQQLTTRKHNESQFKLGGPFIKTDYIVDELKAAIILFFALLDEKQRRLYAGIESLKIGHGGDTQVSALLGLDVMTVARGRRELMSQEIESNRVRKCGGGRKSLGKKHQKSSSTSKR